MRWIPWFLKSCWSIHLALMIVFSLELHPLTVLASDIEFTPAVSDVVKKFSANYCAEIANGGDPEKAVEAASRQMISGLIFSGVMKEVIAAPKEDLSEFVSTEIVYTCGQDISISQQELKEHLLELAQNGDMPKQSAPQPFRPFGIG